jgi:selenocysteine lyase/cysteine desulfurase
VTRRETGMTTACASDLRQAMAALRLPGPIAPSREASLWLNEILRERHGFEAGVTGVAGALHLRISVVAYNDERDFDGLGEAVLEAVRALS